MSKKGALLRKMMAKQGRKWNEFHPNSRLGKALRKRGVEDHPELARVLALPRRNWEEDEDLDFMVEALTEWLKKPDGAQTLRELQAAGLSELHDIEGLLGPMTVGSGKTLFTKLAPVVLGCERPLLLYPGGLRDKTKREFAALDEHWQSHPNLKLMTYEILGRVGGEEKLFDIRPDFIECDEVHFLKNLRAGRTRAVAAYMREFPETIFMGVSGTVTKRSLWDFHHLLYWALGPKNMPLPAKVSVLAQWALALDEKVSMNQRMQPGALRVFVGGKSLPTRQEVRVAVGKRIRETPGVVSMLRDKDVDASIYMNYWSPKPDIEIERMAEDVSRKHVMPDGEVVLDPSEVWRHIKELTCGFYYTWAEEPPKKWMEARRKWRKYVRHVLDEDHADIRTEAAVKVAIRKNRLKDRRAFDAWMKIKDSYKPKHKAVWVSTSTLEALAKKFEGDELIWVESRATGEKLSEMTGYPYFNRGGMYKGKPIEARKGASAILSIKSNKEGRNLQEYWHKNTVVTPPSEGDVWHQLLGRTHRFGQLADAVTVLVMLGHPVLEGCLRQAFADAHYQDAMASEHKLLLADTSRTFLEAA